MLYHHLCERRYVGDIFKEADTPNSSIDNKVIHCNTKVLGSSVQLLEEIWTM